MEEVSRLLSATVSLCPIQAPYVKDEEAEAQ